MKLMIGGYAQGKLSYVLLKYQLSEDAVWDSVLPEETELRRKQRMHCVKDGVLPDQTASSVEPIVVNHFHQWVRRRLSEGECPEKDVQSFLNRCENCIIICDEIGNGIVPVDAFEREYRERTGRILIRLAQEAEEVERVICGIGQRIK